MPSEILTQNGVVDVEMTPRQPQAAGMALFERLALDPNVDVQKLGELMSLWERAEARRAEQAFSVALTAAQKEMRPVLVDSENPQTRSDYASYEALDLSVRPIYSKHGFSLSFNTMPAPREDSIRVTCIVRHGDGHREPYQIDMPADGKGARGGDVMTRTHATGAAVTYGQRYLLKMIFNVAVSRDTDGNGATSSETEKPIAAAKFEELLIDLESKADEGIAALTKAFNDLPDDTKNFLLSRLHRPKWDALKAKASKNGARR